jgi:ABC-2 type transport system ATP-binding protein
MIDITNLTFGYKRKQNLFADLSLSIKPGTIHGLLGKNGAGKSSLMKILAGLLRPRSGSCTVYGKAPWKRETGLLKMTYLLPEEVFVPPLSIHRFQSFFAPFYPQFNEGKFSAILSEFELSPDRKLTALSSGERKKAIIAFTLATECKLLLLDEPTNGLDIPSKSQFRKMLAREVAEDRIILVSTHNVRELEGLMDTILIIHHGEIILNSPLSALSSKVTITKCESKPDPKSAIAWTSAEHGFWALSRSDGATEENLDLETLFCICVGQPEKIKAFMKGENREND